MNTSHMLMHTSIGFLKNMPTHRTPKAVQRNTDEHARLLT